MVKTIFNDSYFQAFHEKGLTDDLSTLADAANRAVAAIDMRRSKNLSNGQGSLNLMVAGRQRPKTMSYLKKEVRFRAKQQ